MNENSKRDCLNPRHSLRIRILSMMLALSNIFTFVAAGIAVLGLTAYADNSVPDDNTSISSSLDIYGENSFGDLVADGLLEKNTEQMENNGCNVFSVEMEGNSAFVSYETTGDCSLVIGIYDNEGENLLASGCTEVTSEETEAYVDIDTKTMPEYYYIRAYLVDSDTLRPLCTEYTSPMYTKSMQEFLSKTTADFESDRVMNLDDRDDTNFAVFSEDTILIPTVENVNNIISSDPETQEYIFYNTDEYITSLTVGDIFAYKYDNDVLIIKVGSISIDGDCVTIIGQDTELEEVFDFVRIDGDAPTDTAIVDDSELEDGVTYLGCTEDVSDVAFYGVDIGGSTSYSHKFEFAKTGDETKDDRFKSENSFSGSLDFKLEAAAKVYISWSETYFEIKLNYSAKFVAEFTAEASRKSIQLAYFEISPVTGIIVRIRPAVIIEAKGKWSADIELKGTVGFKASTNSGNQNLTTKPKVTMNSEATVTVFVGFSLEPELVILHKNIAEASLKAQAGVELKATILKMSTDDKGIRHDCEACIDGDVSAKINMTATIKLLNKESMKFEFKMADISVHLMDFYYSFDFDEWGVEECPHISYPVSVWVVTSQSAPVSGAKVVAEDNTRNAKSDESGKATIMLSPGFHKLTVSAEGYVTKTATVLVGKYSKSHKVKLYAIGEKTPVEEFKQFLEDAIKNGASDPEDVEYNNPVSGDIPKEYKVKQVSVGGDYTAAITEDGGLYTWGYNKYGQLGNGKNEDSLFPTRILDDVVSVTMSRGKHCCAAITTNGDLYMWGYNKDGQLGNGTTENSNVPVKILENVASVKLSRGYTGYNCTHYAAAITYDGELYTWGNNSFGQLGNGTTTNSYIPVKIMDNISSFDVFNSQAAAISTSDDLYIWGNADYYGVTLGNGTSDNSTVPVKIMGNVSEIVLGENRNAVITKNGDLYMWGVNSYGQFADPSIFGYNILTPTKIMGNVDSICLECSSNGDEFNWAEGSLSQYNGIAILDEYGNLYIKEWNDDSLYKILTHIQSFDYQFNNLSAITIDGSVYVWGYNKDGRLGAGENEYIISPTHILCNAYYMDKYGRNGAAITKDGELYMWGDNYVGQLGDGSTQSSYVPKKVSLGSTPTVSESTYFVQSTFSSAPDSYSSRTFADLIPNETYNYYCVNSRAAKDVLSAENLLYIGQAVSDENGTLTIPDYVPNGILFIKAMTEFDVYNAAITSVETTGNTVSLTWNPVSGASEYEVISYSENGIVSYPKTSDTTLTIDDLESGVYGFVVTSTVYGEQSVPAINDLVLVHVYESVETPKLTVTEVDGKAVLSWDSADNALAYKVFSYENGEYKFLAFTAENTYTVSGLTSGEEYGFIVSACVEDIWSELDESNVIFITMGSHTHNYSTEWKHDNDNHWHECTCGNRSDVAPHEYNDDGECVCGAIKVKQNVVISFPDSVTVTTSLEKIVHNGDTVQTGDKLYIEVIIPDGKKIASLTINCTEFKNNCQYVVGEEDVVIEVEFEEIQPETPDEPEAVITGIAMNSVPAKTSYYPGDTLDLTGASISVSYSNGISQIVAITSSMVSGFDTSTTGTKTLTVTYGKYTTHFKVTVRSKPSSSGGGSSGNRPVNTELSFPVVNGTKMSWLEISDMINHLNTGERIEVDLNGDVTVPAFIFRDLSNSSVSMNAKLNDEFTWVVDGNKIFCPDNPVELIIRTVGVYVPDSAISTVPGEITNKFHINQTIENIEVRVSVGEKNNGIFANLYKYNTNSNQLEFVAVAAVDSIGNALLSADADGDYVIMVDTYSALPGDVDNNGELDANDAAMILKYIVELITLTRIDSADYNRDGIVNALDASAILKATSSN